MQMSSQAPSSYRNPVAPPSQRQQYVQRKGIVGWWLDLTAPPRPNRTLASAESERLRKAELTSLSIIPIFLLLIALVSNSLESLATAKAVIAMAIVLIITAVLNRFGLVRLAAYLMPAFLFILLAFSVISAPGLRLIGFPIYDLFVLPILVVSLTGDRSAPWYFAVLAIVFIIADYQLQPHDLITVSGGLKFDEIAYEQKIYGVWGMINRHIALCFFAAFFGWLGALSVDNAIKRADRAEELARLESLVAEQKRALDYGVDQLTQAFIRSANGDFGARVNIPQQNPLWGLGAQMNTFVQRLGAANQANFELERARQEAYRLATALDDWRAGRIPLWPAPSGTVVDPLIQRLSGVQPAQPQVGDSRAMNTLNPPRDSSPYSGPGSQYSGGNANTGGNPFSGPGGGNTNTGGNPFGW